MKHAPATPLLWVLLCAAVATYFVGLGSSSIWDANEAFYVETPKQMVLTGDYVNPSFNGEPRFNKPVLSYWIVAGLYKVLGARVGVERLGIACGATGLFIATFVIGRVARSTSAGLIATIILASSPRVLMWSRRIFIDMYLTMFMALTLMFFVLAISRPHRRARYLVLMYVAIGLGVLTKGPVAAALPLLVCGVYLAWTRQLSEWRRLMLPSGCLIVIAMVAPWYVAVYAQHGWSYIADFIMQENIGRYAETFGLQDRGPFFYLGVLLSDLFPWALLLPVALVLAWRRTPHSAAPSHNLSRLLFTWIAVIVLVFTCSHTKQDLYIFPIVPAVAVLMALALDDAIASGRGVTMTTVSVIVVSAGMLIAGWGLVWLFGSNAGANAIAGAAPMAIVIASGAILAVSCVARRKINEAVISVGTAMVAANWILVLVALPSFERFKPIVPMTRVIQSGAHADAVVAQYQIILPSMAYYLGHPFERFFDIPSLARRAESLPAMYIVIRPAEYSQFQAEAKTRSCEIDRRPLFEDKISNILRREPLPQLLLVGVNGACR